MPLAPIRSLLSRRKARAASKAVANGACVPEGVRVYVLGDIHGRADLLREKFRLIDEDSDAHPGSVPIEVLLGDYIDRGPASSEVMDLILARTTERRVVPLRGNHEQMLLDCLRDPKQLLRWAPNGGLETLASYGVRPPRRLRDEDLDEVASAAAAAVPDAHVEFIEALEHMFDLGDYLFVHAGVRPGVDLSLQEPSDLMWIREEFLQSNQDFGYTVVHGHSPVMAPEIKRNRINIDTGAYVTGRLTCLVLEGAEVTFL